MGSFFAYSRGRSIIDPSCRFALPIAVSEILSARSSAVALSPARVLSAVYGALMGWCDALRSRRQLNVYTERLLPRSIARPVDVRDRRRSARSELGLAMFAQAFHARRVARRRIAGRADD